MSRIICFFIVIIISFSGLAQITLEECQTMAKDNYPLIKQYELIEQTKGYTLSNASKAYLPRFDLTIIGGILEGLPSFTPPGSTESSSTEFNLITVAQLNQAIWDGGITKSRKQIAEAAANIEKADLDVSLYALEDRVNNLFFGILLVEEQIEHITLLKSTLDRNMKSVQNAVDGGTAYKTDIDEIKVEMINADQKIEELKYNRSAYLNVLSAMIGQPIDENTSLIKPEIEESFLNLDINRPELSLFQNQEYLIESQTKMDKTALYPKFGIMALGVFIRPGTEFGTSTMDNLFIGGLSLNWNIGGLYTNSNNKKISEVKLQQIYIQRETFLFNTNLELTRTQQELAKYKALIKQDEELLALKSRIAKAYQAKYDNGISTMTELLNRTNDEHLAKQNLIVHEIKYLMKAYEYRNKSGN